MKKILAVLLIGMMIATNAYCISWTKSWSAADDGSPFSGSDIEDIQNDINTQTPTLTGNNTMSGNNTFSGTTTFSGTIVGVTGSAAHVITRGFELVWKSTTVVTVNTGTLYHNTTQVNKATVTDLDITAAGDAIDGATAQQATSAWRYVYVDSSGNIKLWSTAPDKSDTSGNTAGTKIYYYYVATTTYYRCIGAIRLNATGAGEIEKFVQTGNVVTYGSYQTVATATAEGAYTTQSCAVAVPPISTLAVFYVYHGTNVSPTNTSIYLGVGSSGTSTTRHHAGDTAAPQSPTGAGELTCALSSTQTVDYQTTNCVTVVLAVSGYYMSIR